jgi:outer membrane receptor protein involved in Fe transport
MLFLSQFTRLTLLLCVSAFLSCDIFAQSSANLTGQVTDAANASVAGAEVKLRATGGAVFTARAGADGRYSFANLKPGAYLLEISAPGFAPYVSQRLAVEGNLSHDAQLAVAAISEAVTVTANGTPQRADEVAKSLTTLTNLEAIAVTEALRYTPGLRVQQQGGPGALTSLRFRGLRTSDTALLLDGLRVRDAGEISGSSASLVTDLLPVNLDRIEILRGSGSSLYGTNAVGGAVNLVPLTGAGRPRWEAGAEGGNLGQFRGRFGGAGGVGEQFGYSFNATRYDARRGVDGNDEYGNTAGGGRVFYALTPGVSVSGNFYGSASNARVNDSPFALPAAFTGTQPRTAVAGRTFQPDFNNPDQGRRHRLLVGSARFSQQVNEIFSYTVAYQRVSSRRRNYNGPLVDPRFTAFVPFGDFEFVSTNNGVTDTLDARANLQIGRRNLATFGFEFERETLFQSSLPSFSTFNNTTDRQRTLAIFGQDQIFLLDNRLQISLAARGQFYRVRGADRPGNLSNISPESSVTGDGSVAYFIRETGTKFRAHAGNGFRAASLFERFGEGTFGGRSQRFGDPTLRAEQSVSVDGGIDQYLFTRRLQFSATYFYTRLQRVVAFQSFNRDPLNAGRFFGYVNRPGGLARGVELALDLAPWRGFNFRGSYTYTNSDRKGGVLQREFVVPEHLSSLTATQRWRNFTFAGNFYWNGSYLAPVFENGGQFRQANLRFSGFVKVDSFVNYQRPLNDRVTLTFFAGADNLFNRTYFENGFRAPGAIGRGGMTVKF